MCGIVGFIGDREAAPILFNALTKLEYRGYDSAGLATINNGGLCLKKDAGKLAEVNEKHQLDKPPEKLVLGMSAGRLTVRLRQQMPTLTSIAGRRLPMSTPKVCQPAN